MPAKRTKREVPPSSTRYGRILLVLEEIREQNRATAEAFFATRQEIVGIFESRFQQIEHRLSALEAAVKWLSEQVRKNSEDIRKNTEAIQTISEDLRKNSEDIQKNSEDIQKNGEDIKKNGEDIKKNSEDIKKHTEELVALRVAVARLEARAFQVDQKLAIEGLERRMKVVEERLGI